MARILIIAPHADDEIIGCGGMMAKRKDTDDVYVCIVALTNRHQTEEEATVRKLEMHKAHSLLDVKDSCILTHESGYLDLEPM